MQYVEHMIQYASQGKETFKNKRVAISGFGNVAQYAALKAIELGAIVVSFSDSKGTIFPTGQKGISSDDMANVINLKKVRLAGVISILSRETRSWIFKSFKIFPESMNKL